MGKGKKKKSLHPKTKTNSLNKTDLIDTNKASKKAATTDQNITPLPPVSKPLATPTLEIEDRTAHKEPTKNAEFRPRNVDESSEKKSLHPKTKTNSLNKTDSIDTNKASKKAATTDQNITPPSPVSKPLATPTLEIEDRTANKEPTKNAQFRPRNVEESFEKKSLPPKTKTNSLNKTDSIDTNKASNKAATTDQNITPPSPVSKPLATPTLEIEDRIAHKEPTKNAQFRPRNVEESSEKKSLPPKTKTNSLNKTDSIDTNKASKKAATTDQNITPPSPVSKPLATPTLEIEDRIAHKEPTKNAQFRPRNVEESSEKKSLHPKTKTNSLNKTDSIDTNKASNKAATTDQNITPPSPVSKPLATPTLEIEDRIAHKEPTKNAQFRPRNVEESSEKKSLPPKTKTNSLNKTDSIDTNEASNKAATSDLNITPLPPVSKPLATPTLEIEDRTANKEPTKNAEFRPRNVEESSEKKSLHPKTKTNSLNKTDLIDTNKASKKASTTDQNITPLLPVSKPLATPTLEIEDRTANKEPTKNAEFRPRNVEESSEKKSLHPKTKTNSLNKTDSIDTNKASKKASTTDQNITPLPPVSKPLATPTLEIEDRTANKEPTKNAEFRPRNVEESSEKKSLHPKTKTNSLNKTDSIDTNKASKKAATSDLNITPLPPVSKPLATPTLEIEDRTANKEPTKNAQFRPRNVEESSEKKSLHPKTKTNSLNKTDSIDTNKASKKAATSDLNITPLPPVSKSLTTPTLEIKDRTARKEPTKNAEFHPRNDAESSEKKSLHPNTKTNSLNKTDSIDTNKASKKAATSDLNITPPYPVSSLLDSGRGGILQTNNIIIIKSSGLIGVSPIPTKAITNQVLPSKVKPLATPTLEIEDRTGHKEPTENANDNSSIHIDEPDKSIPGDSSETVPTHENSDNEDLFKHPRERSPPSYDHKSSDGFVLDSDSIKTTMHTIPELKIIDLHHSGGSEIFHHTTVGDPLTQCTFGPRNVEESSEPNDQGKTSHDSSKDVKKHSTDVLQNQARKKSDQLFTFGCVDYEKIHDEFDKFEQWERSKCKLQETCSVRVVFGDLFEAPKEYSLAHCVAEDMRMGSGLNARFRAMFGSIDDLLEQRQLQGGLALLQDGGRFIYYMITKKHSTGKPTYAAFSKSLTALRNHIAENNVTKLAIPRIGCELDSLDWSKVLNMIKFIFQKVRLEILIFNYQQDNWMPKNYSRSPRVIHRKMPLVCIEPETALFFVASEDRELTPEISSIDNKFHIRDDYKNSIKKMGEIILIKSSEYIFGLVVRKTVKDPISWTSFKSCLLEFNKINSGNNQCAFVGIQAFTDRNDPTVVENVINLLKSLSLLEINICYPNKLQYLIPSNRSF